MPLNVHDAVLQLSEGHCDLLLAYHHASQPLQLDPDRYEMLNLGRDTLAAFARPDPDGQALFRLPGHPGQKIPFLAYAEGRLLGRGWLRSSSKRPVCLCIWTRCYETDMAEGLKAMALRGPWIGIFASQFGEARVACAAFGASCTAGCF